MTAKQFAALHHQASPLLLANVWDVASAKTVEKLQFSAIATSSAAIATMLGYRDGEQMAFAEMLYIVKRIAAATALPFSVDIEGGYSERPEETVAHIRALAEVGVVGINIEDSKVDSARGLRDAGRFADYLATLKHRLAGDGLDVFVNVRTDPFLVGMDGALAETLERARLYQAAGADGLFVPCITDAGDIGTVVASTTLPVNVLAMPALPDFGVLTRLGVKRISMGNWAFDSLQTELAGLLGRIRQAQSFQPLFGA